MSKKSRLIGMIGGLLVVLLVSFLVVLPVLAQQPTYQFVNEWGREGSGQGLFNYPRAITISPDERVYVADSENHRVQVFTLAGEFVTAWGSYGSGQGQFDVPQGIAVDAQGSVYISDRNNSRIQKFSASGQFITAWGSSGSGQGQFVEPRNLAVDAAGFVYVGDSQNNRIQKFTGTGQFVTAWGGPGSGESQFNYATGVAVSADGVVFVCDAENHRIQVFDTDGNFQRMWGSQGGGPGQFDRPYSVTVDAAGFVYVVDEWNHRIQKFTARGDFVTMWGSEGAAPGQFEYPHGTAVDGRGYVYVVDEWNQRVQVFQPTSAPANETPLPAPTIAVQSTPRPTPLLTPVRGTAVPPGFDVQLVGQQGETLYTEDFQDNTADGWTLAPDWMIMQDPTGNYVLMSFGPGRVDLSTPVGDLYLSFRLWITSGGVTVVLRPAEGNTVHGMTFSAASARLFVRHVPDPAMLLVQNDTPLPPNTWHDVVIASNGTQIQVIIDGQLWIDAVSGDLPRSGLIGFIGPDSGEVWLDDVTISALVP